MESPRLKRPLGLLAMIASVLAIVLSLLAIVGIWTGRGAVFERLDAVIVGSDGKLEQVEARAMQLSVRLEDARVRVDSLRSQAETLAEGNQISRRIVEGLLSNLDEEIGADLRDARDNYIAIRERLATISARMEQLRGVFPGLPVLPLPIEELQAVDGRFREIDATIAEIRSQLIDTESPGTSIFTRIAEGSQRLVDGIEEVASVVTSALNSLSNAREGVKVQQAIINDWVTQISLILSGVCVYIALLNVSLFAHGRSWFRNASAPVVAELVEGETPIAS
jgi:methyl-accepting chemotaxis protein